jgi:uncharacterized protein YjbI with pentapeptide repeats
MEEADMRGSSLQNAILNHANLRGANFDPLLFGEEGASQRFCPCNFENASMRYANFENANLKNAMFKGADLSYANFKGCDLRGADFTGATYDKALLEDANLKDAIFEQTEGGKAFSLKALSDTEE